VAPSGTDRGQSRVLLLSKVETARKNQDGPCIVVHWSGYNGVTNVRGARLVGRVAKAQGHQEKPAYALLADSKTKPGDVLAVPEMTRSDDHLELEWVRQGSVIRVDLERFMTLKGIVIPAGMKLQIPLYEDTDEDYGPVVGLGLGATVFVKVQSRSKKTVGTA
jgi:hypothetical protein